MKQALSGIVKKFNDLPVNSKLLAGILAVAVIVGGIFVYKAVDQSAWMDHWRAQEALERYDKKLKDEREARRSQRY